MLCGCGGFRCQLLLTVGAYLGRDEGAAEAERTDRIETCCVMQSERERRSSSKFRNHVDVKRVVNADLISESVALNYMAFLRKA